MQIEGASALVAGGASGLGAATARALHERGASVVIADLNAEKGEALAGELGERAGFMEANVMEPEPVQAAVDAAAGRGGRPADLGLLRRHRLGAAHRRQAGPARPRDLPQRDQGQPDRHLQRAAPRRRRRCPTTSPTTEGERGVCINTASIAACDGQIGQVAYSASKGGIVGLTLPAARDLAGRGVRVVTIAPGLFDTPLLAALPEEPRQALGAGDPLPVAARPSRGVRRARPPDRRQHDAERRDDPAGRRAADAAALGRQSRPLYSGS